MLLLCAEQKALVTYNRVESRCSAGQGCCCPGQEGRVVRATGRMLYVTRTVMRVLLRRILELAPYWSLRLYHVNGGQGLNVFKDLQTSLRQYQYFNGLRKNGHFRTFQ